MTQTHFDYLVYIGRFQPFHVGHAAMLEQALAQAARVVLVLGSAKTARNVRNPFTVAERREMILAAVPHLASRIDFVEMRDYYDGKRWAAAVRSAVTAVLPVHATVGLFGHFKDASSGYLRDFPSWPLVQVGNVDGINAADIRTAWFGANGDVAGLDAMLAPSVVSFLQAFAQGGEFARLKAEFDYLNDYREQWSHAPYPPVFVTVDAVVRCCDHVLLVQRGGQPGVGNWALPGGFLDQHERVSEASLRELMEETCLDVSEAVLRECRQGPALFDHPDRSLRGRTLTHAFYYPLDLPELPAIRAADDAAAAKWVPIVRLAEMEATVHDDHYLILDWFLGLIDKGAC
jgi:bifunctional NMN adenylyltransferase/nudix hydrolase